MIKKIFAHSYISFIVAALVAIGVLAGCGGSEDSLTKAEFIKQGDELCEKTNKTKDAGYVQYQKDHKGFGEPLDRPELEEVAATVARPVMQERVDGFNDLSGPSEDEDRIEAIVAAYEKVISMSEDKPLVLFKVGGPMLELQEAAEAYGFKACGQASN